MSFFRILSGKLGLLLHCLRRLQLGQQRLRSQAGRVIGSGLEVAQPPPSCAAVVPRLLPNQPTAFQPVHPSLAWIFASFSRTSCSSFPTLVSRICTHTHGHLRCRREAAAVARQAEAQWSASAAGQTASLSRSPCCPAHLTQPSHPHHTWLVSRSSSSCASLSARLAASA